MTRGGDREAGHRLVTGWWRHAGDLQAPCSKQIFGFISKTSLNVRLDSLRFFFKGADQCPPPTCFKRMYLLVPLAQIVRTLTEGKVFPSALLTSCRPQGAPWEASSVALL